jgi:hypothetical protein
LRRRESKFCSGKREKEREDNNNLKQKAKKERRKRRKKKKKKEEKKEKKEKEEPHIQIVAQLSFLEESFLVCNPHGHFIGIVVKLVVFVSFLKGLLSGIRSALELPPEGFDLFLSLGDVRRFVALLVNQFLQGELKG